MQLSIRTKHIKLNQRLRYYVEEKIGDSLDRLLDSERPPLKADVELMRLTRGQKKGKIFRAEVQATLHGHKLIFEETGESIEQAIDQVKDGLEREIKKHRGKETTMTRKRARFLKRILSLSPFARFRRDKDIS